jgi:hypothetical protein
LQLVHVLLDENVHFPAFSAVEQALGVGQVVEVAVPFTTQPVLMEPRRFHQLRER